MAGVNLGRAVWQSKELLILSGFHETSEATLYGCLSRYSEALLPASLAPIANLNQLMARPPLHQKSVGGAQSIREIDV
jgi:hypothetical protein